MDLAQNTGCSGNDVVPGVPEEARRQRLVGRRRRLRRQHQPRRRRRRRRRRSRSGRNNRTPDQILADARAEFESWRKPPPSTVPLCGDAETRLWRQSEAVLRMGQIREPNTATRKNNGMMLASLPPGSWHTGWVRDATYAVVALARVGPLRRGQGGAQLLLERRARRGLRQLREQRQLSHLAHALLRQRAGGVRLGQLGAEHRDRRLGPGPVGGARLRRGVGRHGVAVVDDAVGTVYDVLNQQVAGALESNLEPSRIVRADSSIWEVHQPGKHYAFTTMAAARGFCDMAAMAKKSAARPPTSRTGRWLAAR